MALVLVVDDDPIVRDLVRAVFTREGAQVVEAASLGAGQAALASGCDLLVSDLGLPDGEGTQLLRQADGQGVPHICMSARVGRPPREATRFLRKPVPLAKLAALGRELLPDMASVSPLHRNRSRHDARVAALASVSEALGRADYGTLPLREVLIRFMNEPDLRFVGIYERGPGGLPLAVDWAGRQQEPREVDAFFGRADLLGEVLQDPEVTLEIPGEVVPASGCCSLTVLPMVYGGEHVAALVCGGSGPADRGFYRAMLSQLLPMMMLLRLQTWMQPSTEARISVS